MALTTLYTTRAI
jgi:hypothetical protein